MLIEVPKMHNFVVLGIFSPSDVLPFAIYPFDTNGKRKNHRDKSSRREYTTEDGNVWDVKMISHRYWVFKNNPSCVSCGITGTFMALERNHTPRYGSPHFNLYAIGDDESWVLITKDHIHPKSKGGQSVIENYQTMCGPCNFTKGQGE